MTHDDMNGFLCFSVLPVEPGGDNVSMTSEGTFHNKREVIHFLKPPFPLLLTVPQCPYSSSHMLHVLVVSLRAEAPSCDSHKNSHPYETKHSPLNILCSSARHRVGEEEKDRADRSY